MTGARAKNCATGGWPIVADSTYIRSCTKSHPTNTLFIESYNSSLSLYYLYINIYIGIYSYNTKRLRFSLRYALSLRFSKLATWSVSVTGNIARCQLRHHNTTPGGYAP